MHYIQFIPKPVIVDTSKFEGDISNHPCLKEMPECYELIKGDLPKEFDTINYESPNFNEEGAE